VCIMEERELVKRVNVVLLHQVAMVNAPVVGFWALTLA